MLVYRNILFADGSRKDLRIPSNQEIEEDASSLLAFKARIDPHVHFRTPGDMHKEDWVTGSQAALAGGVGTVFDMPNTTPLCTSLDVLREKEQLVQNQIQQSEIPLRHFFYFGADRHNLQEIERSGDEVVGIKVFMGSSTGNLLVDDWDTLTEIFALAAKRNWMVAVHAEDERVIASTRSQIQMKNDPSLHSQIRTPRAAAAAIRRALRLVEQFGTKLSILHVSSEEELHLIRSAKKAGLPVFAEACVHHLFLDLSDYEQWGTRVQVNPPLRTLQDRQALWNAVEDGTIDWIGTDHAPHTLEEKNQPFGKAPSGIPSIELAFPLLLDAWKKRGWCWQRLEELTSINIERIFAIPVRNDWTLVDLNCEKEVRDEQLWTKCSWSPFHGTRLQGWPRIVILDGKEFKIKDKQCSPV